MLNDWTGGIYASKKNKLGGLVVWGGGHTGYYGNEVYFFDLKKLKWSRLTDPTIGQIPGNRYSFGLNKKTCQYHDGHPIAFHTYDSVTYIPSTNQFFLPVLWDHNEGHLGKPIKCFSINYHGRGMVFNFDSSTWSSLKTRTPPTSYTAISEFDDKRNAVWLWKSGRISKSGGLSIYHIDSGNWINFKNDSEALKAHSNGAIDPIRDLFVVTEFQYNHNRPRIIVKDLKTPDLPFVIINTSGDNEIENEKNSKLGFEWVPKLKKFVAWSSNSSLYYLTPPKISWRTEPWIWKKVTLAGKTPSPPHAGPGGKFQVVPALNIAIVVTDRKDAVYAVKLAQIE